jgi:hypothetical protein
LYKKATAFGNDPAVVCCKIAYHTTVDQIGPSKVDKTLRKSLWKAYQNGLYDGLIIQVEGKQFKVS